MKQTIIIFTILLFGCSKEHTINVSFSDEYKNLGYEIVDFDYKDGVGAESRYYIITNKPLEGYSSIVTFFDKTNREILKLEISDSKREKDRDGKYYNYNNPSFQYYLRPDFVHSGLVYKILISSE